MPSERVPFRLIVMPCCNHHVCWVNPRLPTYCPECGEHVYPQVRSSVAYSDSNAMLTFQSSIAPPTPRPSERAEKLAAHIAARGGDFTFTRHAIEAVLAETQARLVEDEQLIIALWRYGELRPVEGVLYPEGSHRALLDKARKVYERHASRTSPPAAAAERGETT